MKSLSEEARRLDSSSTEREDPLYKEFRDVEDTEVEIKAIRRQRKVGRLVGEGDGLLMFPKRYKLCDCFCKM